MDQDVYRNFNFSAVAFAIIGGGISSIFVFCSHYETVERFDDTTKTTSFALLAICVFFLHALWEQYNTRKAEVKEEEEQLTLAKLYLSTKDIIKGGYEARCERLGKTNDDEKLELLYQVATESVKKSARGEDIVTQAKLETLSAKWVKTFLLIQASIPWTIFVYVIVIAHLILSFVQSSLLRGEEHTQIGVVKLHLSINPVAWDSVLEFLFTCIELADVTMRYFAYRHSGDHILFPKSEIYFIWANFGVVAYIFFDWIICIAFNISPEFIIPVRPMLLVLMNRSLRQELVCCVSALYEMIPIIILYVGLVLNFGIFAFLIWGINYEAWEEAEGDDMHNIIRASVQMFVFLSAGENYTTMVYPALKQGRMGIVFFIVAMFIGIFVFMAMITGIFEHAFSNRSMKEKLRKRWWKRTGMVAAYTLIDLDGDGCISHKEFATYLQHLNNEFSEKDIYDLMETFLDGDRSGNINLKEFVNGLEKISFQKLFSKPLASPQNESQIEGEQIIESWWYRKTFLLLCICSFWLFATYNAVHSVFIDFIVIFIVVVHAAELCFRIYAFGGFNRYFFLSQYQNCEKRNVDQFSNRFDAALTTIALIGICPMIALMAQSTMNEHSFIRIFPGCVLIRFFFRWQVSKELCFMLRSGAKIVASLLILMLTLFFIFGVVGVTLFKDGLQNIPEDSGVPEYGIDFANFDNLGNSYIFLTQAFLGEAFHELLAVTRECWIENTTKNKDNWGGNWFVIIFFFLMSVLFNNLFFGLLLNIFSDLYEAQQDGEELNKELVRHTSMPSIFDKDSEDSFLVEDLTEPSMSFKRRKTNSISRKNHAMENQNVLTSINIDQIECEDPV